MPHPYLPENSPRFFTLQPLASDRRYIAFYEGADHHPYCIPRPLTLDECQSFLSSDKGPVTFTVRVPLKTVVLGGEAIREYVEQTAFDFPAKLASCEFRPVGACISEFSEEFAGDVLLQVSCAIAMAST